MDTEVKVVVTLQFDSEEFYSRDEVELAAVEATQDAMNYFAQRVGFQHHLAYDASLGLVSVGRYDGDALRSALLLALPFVEDEHGRDLHEGGDGYAHTVELIKNTLGMKTDA